MDVLARLSDEHGTLLPLIVDIQAAAEARDNAALVARLIAGRAALTEELDAHIALEEDAAFTLIEKAVGGELVASFRTEHTEIRTLRDDVLAGADAGSVPVGLCLQLCDLIQAHMRREDTMLFPSADDALDPYTLEIRLL
jgi:hemerythrin-like domain-containing protein